MMRREIPLRDVLKPVTSQASKSKMQVSKRRNMRMEPCALERLIRLHPCTFKGCVLLEHGVIPDISR